MILSEKMPFLGSFKHGFLHGHGLLKWKSNFGEDHSYLGTFFYNCLHESGKYDWDGNGTYIGAVLFLMSLFMYK